MEAMQEYLDRAAELRGKILDDFHEGLWRLVMEYDVPLTLACREIVDLRDIIDDEFASNHEKRHAIFRRMVRVYRDPWHEGITHNGEGTGLGYTTLKIRVGRIRVHYSVDDRGMPVIERTKHRDRAYSSTTKRKGGR